jgi:hypothetical protein
LICCYNPFISWQKTESIDKKEFAFPFLPLYNAYNINKQFNKGDNMEEKGKMNWGWAVKRSPEQYWEEELSEEETALHMRNRNREDRVEELNFEE